MWGDGSWVFLPPPVLLLLLLQPARGAPMGQGLYPMPAGVLQGERTGRGLWDA